MTENWLASIKSDQQWLQNNWNTDNQTIPLEKSICDAELNPWSKHFSTQTCKICNKVYLSNNELDDCTQVLFQ